MKTSPVMFKQSKQAFDKYAIKLKSFWRNAFSIYGIDMCSDGKVSQRNQTIFAILALIQFTILLHFMVSNIYTILSESTITKIGYYAGLIVSGFISVYNMWSMNKRRKTMSKLHDDAISHLSGYTECVKKLWNYCVITSVCLLTLCIVDGLCSVVEVLEANVQVYNFTSLYFFNIDIADEDLYITRIVVAIEFFTVLFVSAEFVNLSVGFFTHMCHLVYYRFKHLNVKLEKILRSGKQLSNYDLFEYRKKHQLACEVTEELSCVWSPLILFWLFGFILSLCFDLRALNLQGSCLQVIAYGTDILRQLWLIFELFKAASLVNVEAHKLTEKLVTFSISKSALMDTDQMDYYVNYLLLNERLINTRIGINASGLFLLNYSSFLSMVGTVLTYVIVLYQSY
uniref:Gustatory receptor n=1 Tax=Strigamia maritima TaxID=126957 RepID=T1JDU3_STRMM